ncbi:hypothetical protein V5O48_016928 [Marasmius crinis-equi]|uniref:Uncharacterized protein n=1 Tax=Marasmius crinis-equi TaxID=585013 RepID=A0ABR3EQD7_9AGAR
MPSNPTSKTLPGTPNTDVTTATEISPAGTRWYNTGGTAVTTHTVVNATSISTLKRTFGGTGTTITGGVMNVGIVSQTRSRVRGISKFKARKGLDDHLENSKRRVGDYYWQ